MKLLLSSPLPSILLIFSFRLQHEKRSEFYGVSVQAINIPFKRFNFQNRCRDLNVVRWHSPSDLHPRVILMQTGMSAVCTILSSLVFILKLSPDKLCTGHTDHAILSHKIEFIARFRRPRWSSSSSAENGDSPRCHLPLGHGAASCLCCWPRRRCSDFWPSLGRPPQVGMTVAR
jgi:hypothetical protein